MKEQEIIKGILIDTPKMITAIKRKANERYI